MGGNVAENLSNQSVPEAAARVAAVVNRLPGQSQLAPQVPQAISVEEDGALQSGGKKADSIKDWERELILETLASVGGSRKLAVEKLGISERTLRHKLRQYRLAGYLNE